MGEKKIVRIDNTLQQASTHSFKSQAREIITNLWKQEVSHKIEEQIAQAAKQIMETEKKYQPDWFTQSLL